MNLLFCIESSYEKGMGHLFRSLNLANAVQRLHPKSKICFAANRDQLSEQLILKAGWPMIGVDFGTEDWERPVLETGHFDIWINDRLDTSADHAKKIKSAGMKLITFDDRGAGAGYSDLHVAPLIFGEDLQGAQVLHGPSYLVFSATLSTFVRQRNRCRKILIAMGGSDNHGLTRVAIECLRDLPFEFTVLLGPLNRQFESIRAENPNLSILRSSPSVGEVFIEHDLLICAGGVMPFEALATGLPVIACAAEAWERPVAQFIQAQKVGYYSGFRDEIRIFNWTDKIQMIASSIETMSIAASEKFDFNGPLRLVEKIVS